MSRARFFLFALGLLAAVSTPAFCSAQTVSAPDSQVAPWDKPIPFSLEYIDGILMKPMADGSYEMVLVLTPEGQKRMAEITAKHVGEKILIEPFEPMMINEPITGTTVSVSTTRTEAEARQIVAEFHERKREGAKSQPNR